MIDEGYIKFSLTMKEGDAPEHASLDELNAARQKLFTLKLIGVYENGIGYGNVSLRGQGNRFIITGSATGQKLSLQAADYCEVETFDLNQNRVVAVGQIPASSESMTHGAVYEAEPRVQSVMHIHSRLLFDRMLKEGHPHTPKEAAFGTPALALAIADLVKQRGSDSGVFATAGHDEGIIAYGPSIADTLALLLALSDSLAPSA